MFFGMKQQNEQASSRNSRKDSGAHNAVYESRRALNSYDLQPPEYQIKPQYLIDDYVEKAVLVIILNEKNKTY